MSRARFGAEIFRAPSSGCHHSVTAAQQVTDYQAPDNLPLPARADRGYPFTARTMFVAGNIIWPWPIDSENCGFMQIIVRDNNVDQALRALKKKLQREGVYREMKLRRHYEKPSEKRARERAAAVRRARKLERKRAERDGAR